MGSAQHDESEGVRGKGAETSQGLSPDLGASKSSHARPTAATTCRAWMFIRLTGEAWRSREGAYYLPRLLASGGMSCVPSFLLLSFLVIIAERSRTAFPIRLASGGWDVTAWCSAGNRQPDDEGKKAIDSCFMPRGPTATHCLDGPRESSDRWRRRPEWAETKASVTSREDHRGR